MKLLSVYQKNPTLQYDKSGHGLSEEGAVTISDHAADLAALMDTLGLAQALVRSIGRRYDCAGTVFGPPGLDCRTVSKQHRIQDRNIRNVERQD